MDSLSRLPILFFLLTLLLTQAPLSKYLKQAIQYIKISSQYSTRNHNKLKFFLHKNNGPLKMASAYEGEKPIIITIIIIIIIIKYCF